jgi:hypothetical protein
MELIQILFCWCFLPYLLSYWSDILRDVCVVLLLKNYFGFSLFVLSAGWIRGIIASKVGISTIHINWLWILRWLPHRILTKWSAAFLLLLWNWVNEVGEFFSKGVNRTIFREMDRWSFMTVIFLLFIFELWVFSEHNVSESNDKNEKEYFFKRGNFFPIGQQGKQSKNENKKTTKVNLLFFH